MVMGRGEDEGTLHGFNPGQASSEGTFKEGAACFTLAYVQTLHGFHFHSLCAVSVHDIIYILQILPTSSEMPNNYLCLS